MTYPPPNPYDPNQQPGGYGQPSQPQPGGYGHTPQPPHFATDNDPYARPDQYSQPAYPNPPLSVAPGSAPPGGHYGAGPAFQPGQPAPAPPRGSSNTPLIVTLVVIVAAVAAGAIGIGVIYSGGDEGTVVADDPTSQAEETSEEPAEDPTTAEETTAAAESEYRLPEVEECIENVEEGFYVVACDSDDAFWLVVHIEQNPEDPDPSDAWHSVAGNNACAEVDWDNYYFTDTAVSAGRDWDPDIDSITAIYCVAKVD